MSMTLLSLISFAEIYTIGPDQHYENNELIGVDLLVTKPFGNNNKKNIYWRIRPQDLPVTEDLCDENTFDLCDKNGINCYKPCLQYGPELIIHAKNVNKIYFFSATTEMGATGIGARLLFVGNLDKKQIKYLAIIDADVEAKPSPDGNYIVFYKSSNLNIVNTLNDDIKFIKSNNIYTKQHEEIHDLDTINWISNTCFTYLDKVYGFNKDPIKITENTYDAKENKIINSKRIK